MSKLLALFATIALALVLLPGSASADECYGTITITVRHLSSQANTVTLVDAIDGSTKISGTMNAHEEREGIPICTSNAGYGRVQYKKGGQSGWTESSLLKSGDTVTI